MRRHVNSGHYEAANGNYRCVHDFIAGSPRCPVAPRCGFRFIGCRHVRLGLCAEYVPGKDEGGDEKMVQTEGDLATFIRTSLDNILQRQNEKNSPVGEITTEHKELSSLSYKLGKQIDKAFLCRICSAGLCPYCFLFCSFRPCKLTLASFVTPSSWTAPC